MQDHSSAAYDIATEPSGDRRTNALGRVERWSKAIKTLERERRIRKADLLALLGVASQSSFKRIKLELRRAGLPLTYDAADGYYHVPPAATFARHGTDARQRAQFAQVRAAVAALGGVAEEALGDVLEMLEARITIDDPDAVAVVTSRHPQARGDAAFYAALDRALSAVREHRWLSFTYEPTAGGERTPRTVAPYAVHAHDGRYYVWGTLEGDASPFPAPRLFALDRMRDVAIEDDAFDADPSLDFNDSLRHAFGTMLGSGPPRDVVVRIAPEAAAFVACRRWPAETARAAETGGALRVTFTVTKIDELVAWVLSFGGAATILAPADARHALKSRAEAVLATLSTAVEAEGTDEYRPA